MKTFGVLLFPEVEELDFAGPWELLRMWSRSAGGPERCVLVAQTTAPVTCANGLRVLPDLSFADCPPLDALLVPGGMGTRHEVKNPALTGFVAQQAATAQAMLSVCTGSFVLHAAGLLAGKRATSHWASLDRLRALPGVTVIEQRWVRDGNTWSSAGVSAGMDMMLAFIAEHGGADAAGRVQFSAEYYPDGVTYGNYESHAQAPAYLQRGAKLGAQ
jgi:transcriptional regulator GlxA family with amidase domain